MRYVSVMAALCLAALFLAACATAPEPEAPPEVPRTSLAPRDLGPEECGLFVWRNTPDKTFILFSGRESAIWDGREIAFEATDTPSAPEQSFTAGERDWKLELSRPAQIAEGTRYDAGVLSTQSAEGWDARIPVIGLDTCSPSGR